MIPVSMLLSLALSFLVLALIAGLYVVAAWRLAARLGEVALLGAWVAGSISLAVAYAVIWGFRRGAAGVTISTTHRLMEFGIFFGMSALSFGLATLSVRRRRRHGSDGPSFGAILAGVGAFFAGLILIMVAVLIYDVLRVL